MSTNYLTTRVVSHAGRVKSLYKQSLRHLLSHHHNRHIFRYHAVLLRARFDKNKDIADVREAKKVLLAGEQEFDNKRHYLPIQFANAVGGPAYGRETVMPDWILDMWHPLERAQYPEYFKRREQRKLEFIERYEKKYGKPDASNN